MRPARFTRHSEIQRLRRQLETFGFPRLQMATLVMLTGLAGFTASALLLSGGMLTMWSRYLLALAIAYLVFLGLLWIWLRSRPDDWHNAPDAINALPTPSHHHAHDLSMSVHDGQFGGGGASGSFDGGAESFSNIDVGSGDAVGEALSAAGQAEELAIPLVVIVLLASLVLSSLFMIWAAPTLFAELLVDGVLSASLYRRLRGLQTQNWIVTALRRTFWPFATTALLVAALGWGMSLYAPGAHSIGEVIAHANSRTR